MINPNKGDTMTINNTPPDGSTLPHTEPLAPEDIEVGQPFSPEQAPVDGVPVVTDEELEKQALAHPGADGDPSTPE